MDVTDKVTDLAVTPRVDQQLQNLDEQVQTLLRESGTEQAVCQAPPPQNDRSTQPALPPLAPPKPARQRRTKRVARLAAGAGLLTLATWALAPLVIEVHSAQAVVNAPIVTLRSPINGTVSFHSPAISGASATANSPLFDVKNSLADEDRLDGLKDEKAVLDARVTASEHQLSALAGLRQELATSAGKYQQARLRTLELECEGARAALETARLLERQRQSEAEQIRQLQTSRSASNHDLSAAQFAAEAARHSVVQAEQTVAGLEEQIRSLRGGIHVGPGDGRNDLPYSTQRLHELSVRIEELRSSLDQDRARLAQLERHIQAETRRHSRREQFTSTVPNDSVIWRRHVTSNTTITVDSPLLDVVNPSEIFIDAVISESDLASIKPGDPARIRLAGSPRQWKAEVKQVYGRTLPWPDRLLAVETVPTTSQQGHVILRFREPLSADGGAAPFPVGLPAQVTFQSTGDVIKRFLGLATN